MANTIDTLYERVQGLSSNRDTRISSVVLNGNPIPIDALPSYGYGAEGEVTVNDFMSFMGENGDIAGEFFGEVQATVSPDGVLTIQPESMGTKGLSMVDNLSHLMIR